MTADKTRMSISVFAPGETRERSLSWFDWSLLSDISADGKTIIFSETGEAAAGNYSVFLRKMDGSPAVRLGDGGFGFLSPDSRWVLSTVGAPARLVLLPTGIGEPRQLTDDKLDHPFAAWLPDSKSIIFVATEPGHAPRTYLLDIQVGTPHALTPEGVFGALVTPDGKHVLGIDTKQQVWLYPVSGGDPQKLNITVGANENAVAYTPDGKGILVAAPGLPLKIERLDLATGRRQPWKEIAPADPAGVQNVVSIRFSADQKAYAYSILRVLSDLFVVDGLK